MDLSYWVDELAQKFPEFARSATAWNRDLAYDVFGSFAIFICARIRASGEDDIVLRAFELLNEMAEEKSGPVDDLIVSGVLEVLGDHDICRKAAEAHLVSRGKELLQRGVLGWPHRPPGTGA